MSEGDTRPDRVHSSIGETSERFNIRIGKVEGESGHSRDEYKVSRISDPIARSGIGWRGGERGRDGRFAISLH